MPKHCEIVLYEEDISKDKIQNIIETHNSIKHYAFILHDRDINDNNELKKAHYHIYLNFGNTNVQFNSIAKWFGCKENMVNKIKTDKVHTMQYFLHLNEADKYHYNIADMVSNMDIKALLDEDSKHQKLTAILQMCGSGIITRRNITSVIDVETYAKYAQKIYKAIEYCEQNTKSNTRNLMIFWLWGEAGTGKTTLALKLAENNGFSTYQTCAGRDPFSLYSGEEAVVFNELRPNQAFTYSELLQLLDPHYSSSIPSRYFNKVPNYELLIITSCFSPEKFTEGCELDKGDSSYQLYRRIYQVWEISEGKVICGKYSDDGTIYSVVNEFVNPLRSILAERKREEIKIDLSILGEPLSKEQPKSVDLPNVAVYTQLEIENEEEYGLPF